MKHVFVACGISVQSSIVKISSKQDESKMETIPTFKTHFNFNPLEYILENKQTKMLNHPY